MRTAIKYFVDLVARLLTLPVALGYWSCALLMGRERAFPGWSQLMSLIPGLSGVFLRRAFYTWVLPECGADACLSFGTVLSHPTARIGSRAYVGLYCVLGDVTLEADVLISSHVSIINGSRQHGIDRLDRPIREQPGHWPRVTIGCDSWIGERAIVQADIGRHCVIGAGAVVIEPIPDYAIAVGVPAKVIRYRTAAHDERLGSAARELSGEPADSAHLAQAANPAIDPAN